MKPATLLALGLAAAVGVTATVSQGQYEHFSATLPKVLQRKAPEKRIVSQDTVLVMVRIGTDGRVRDAMIVRSVPRYDEACVRAARQWVFEPARDPDSGQPIEINLTIPFRFRTVGELQEAL